MPSTCGLNSIFQLRLQHRASHDIGVIAFTVHLPFQVVDGCNLSGTGQLKSTLQRCGVGIHTGPLARNRDRVKRMVAGIVPLFALDGTTRLPLCLIYKRARFTPPAQSAPLCPASEQPFRSRGAFFEAGLRPSHPSRKVELPLRRRTRRSDRPNFLILWPVPFASSPQLCDDARSWLLVPVTNSLCL